MKFSENWLRQWVNPQITTEELGDQLTMAGLELDGVEPAAPDLTGVIVARIDSATPHPDADKLQVCQVNVGKKETRQIVCGAKNARPGLVTALATEGAVLPGGLKIKAAKLRGVESFGMLCAASELGLDEESAGIVELDENLTIGQCLMQALDLPMADFCGQSIRSHKCTHSLLLKWKSCMSHRRTPGKQTLTLQEQFKTECITCSSEKIKD